MTDPTTQARPALHPGDKVSYFEVQAPLAAGGMSLVWKGRDSVLSRDVAIKQLANADQADEQLRERFRTEAELQKKVSASHANLVQVIEFIEDERGLFIVMEYVDGSSLDRVLAKLDGPMDPKQALGIVHQVAAALGAIHKAGVLHRDLKPANILLPRDGGVKVCDFGLATLAEEQEALTMGTARYMAPELFTEEDADGRADIYALGMVAYEMLIGKPKFDEQFRTVLRDQRNQALRWMKWHTNPRLNATPIGKLMPDLPPELSDVVERMMAKDRSVRIDSAETLIEVLKRNFSTAGRARAQAEAQQQAAAAMATSPSEPTAPLPKRSKTPLILAAVLLSQVILIGGIIGYLEMQKGERADQQIRLAQRAYADAKKLYEAGDYAAARDAFDEVAATWPDAPQLPLFCKVRSLICTGMLERANGLDLMTRAQFADAAAAFRASQRAFEDADDAIPADHEQLQKERTALDKERQSSNGYYSFAEPAARIDAFIKQAKLNEARMLIQDMRDKGSLVAREEGVLDDFIRQIVRLEQRARIDKIFTDARKLAADGRPEEGLAMLNDARQRLGTSEFDADIKQITADIRYGEAQRDARRAEERGDLAEAIVQYEAVLEIRPTDELRQRVRSLKSQLAYDEGQRRLAEGDINGAAAKFNESNNYLPNDLATRALAEIGRAAQRSEKVQEGDVAFGAGDMDKAIGAWKVAQGMSYDATTEAKINRAYTRLYADRAEKALMAWRLDDAMDAVLEALKYDPTDPQAVRTKTTLDIAVRYQALMDRGEALYRQGKFGEAGPVFRDARDAIKGSNIDTEPVNKRILDAEYESWMVKARTAVEARQWRQAKAHVSAAKNIRVTREAAELESQILTALEDEEG